MHWPKHSEYNNKDEENSLNTRKDKNYQASSRKLKQIIEFNIHSYPYFVQMIKFLFIYILFFFLQMVTSNINNFLRNLFGWLVGLVLWHINLCRLFNAKSVFMQIISSI